MSEDQLQPSDTLDDRGVDDVLDEGYSPPDREPGHLRHPHEVDEPETLDERLAEEEPDVWGSGDDEDAEESDPESGDEVGDARSGRLVAQDEGAEDEATPSCGPPTPASTVRVPAPRRPRCTSSTTRVSRRRTERA